MTLSPGRSEVESGRQNALSSVRAQFMLFYHNMLFRALLRANFHELPVSYKLHYISKCTQQFLLFPRKLQGARYRAK
jgi:hypothetical protein